MSREIELKVPLTEAQFEKIKFFFLKKEGFESVVFWNLLHIEKSDEYYSLYRTHEERIKNKELRVIRIRSEKENSLEPSGIDMFGEETGEKAFFCIKQKSIENGVEFNSEYESFVENPEVLRKFFETTGYIKWFEKKKDAFSVHCKLSGSDFEAHLEIEKVNGLPYAEIEYTKEDFSPDKVRENLEKILLALEIDPKKRDSRSWAEILGK